MNSTAPGVKIRAVSWHTELAGAFFFVAQKKGFVVHHRDTYPGACKRYTKSRDSRRFGMKEAATPKKKRATKVKLREAHHLHTVLFLLKGHTHTFK